MTRLDGLRGLAACGVALLYHPQSLFAPDVNAALPGLLRWFQHWGWTLVDLFFLISGYIFAHVYLIERSPGQGYVLRRGTLESFAVARAARLYPLHLVMLLVCGVVFLDDPGNTPLALMAHLFMLQGFVGWVGHSFDGPSWSISVECACYVLFALGAVGGRRTLQRVTVLAILGALLHFAVQGRAGGPWVGDGLPRGLLGFFLGQVLWHARARLRHAPSMLLLCLMAIGISLDMGRMSSLLPLSLLAWPALLLLALRLKIMGSAPMRWLGDRSYAIYLVHWPILMLGEQRFGHIPGDGTTWIVVTLLYSALVLLAADVSFRYIEGPARHAIRAVWQRRADQRAQRRVAGPSGASADMGGA
ncbi:acyltransferase [Novosphingobium sp. PhB165]|uniref:acyltransferase family protein n=1 Tax=Novosphingobium sp. PhB165 TaxID=2485105 RepID=UPI001FB2EB38|nr:acyltransferase [Novosphingobium sp. PhB165]